LFEQTVGQACDYFMVIIFLIRYLESKKANEKEMFWHGMWACIFHFGQIYPLIIKGLGATGFAGGLMEWILIFSVVPTFHFHQSFSTKWDTLVAASNTKSNNGETRDPRKQQSVGRIIVILVVSFIISSFVILGPLALPRCQSRTTDSTNAPLSPHFESSGDSGYCVDNKGSITGFTVVTSKNYSANALLQEMEPLITASRSHPGNIYYNLYRHGSESSSPSSQFVFIEKWADVNSLKSHMKSKDVQSVFGGKYFRQLLDTEIINGPWLQIEPCQMSELPPVELSFVWDIKAPLSKLWPVINNWSDCSWVQGAISCSVESNPKIRKLVLPNNGILREELMEADTTRSGGAMLVYRILETPHLFKTYQGTIYLDSKSSSLTQITYLSQFVPLNSVTPSQARDYVKNDFENNRIPFLKALFERST